VFSGIWQVGPASRWAGSTLGAGLGWPARLAAIGNTGAPPAGRPRLDGTVVRATPASRRPRIERTCACNSGFRWRRRIDAIAEIFNSSTGRTMESARRSTTRRKPAADHGAVRTMQLGSG
jgi:hypothetical protein